MNPVNLLTTKAFPVVICAVLLSACGEGVKVSSVSTRSATDANGPVIILEADSQNIQTSDGISVSEAEIVPAPPPPPIPEPTPETAPSPTPVAVPVPVPVPVPAPVSVPEPVLAPADVVVPVTAPEPAPVSTPAPVLVPAPAVSQPADNEVFELNSNIAMKWLADVNASSFDFGLYDPRSESTTYTSNITPVDICTESTCTWNHRIAVPVGQGYKVRIRASNAQGNSTWVERTFSVSGASVKLTETAAVPALADSIAPPPPPPKPAQEPKASEAPKPAQEPESAGAPKPAQEPETAEAPKSAPEIAEAPEAVQEPQVAKAGNPEPETEIAEAPKAAQKPQTDDAGNPEPETAQTPEPVELKVDVDTDLEVAAKPEKSTCDQFTFVEPCMAEDFWFAYPELISTKFPDESRYSFEKPSAKGIGRDFNAVGVSVTYMDKYNHDYSKRQPWNTTEGLYLSLKKDVVNFRTGQLETMVPVEGEAVWSNVNPDLIYGLKKKGGALNQFVSFNVHTKKVTEIAHFQGWSAMTIGQWEGNVSNDDRFVVLAGIESGEKHLLSFDLKQKKILGRLKAKSNFNWSGFSQSGKWILVENNRYPDNNPLLMRYKPDFSEETLIFRSPNHGDFCIDDQGDEVYAMSGKRLEWVKLDSLKVFSHEIASTNYGHVSCRSIKRPGWAYVTLYNPGIVGAFPLTANTNQLEVWGYHRSSEADYDSQAQAAASPSGQKLVFSSDWHGQDSVRDYVFSVKARPRDNAASPPNN